MILLHPCYVFSLLIFNREKNKQFKPDGLSCPIMLMLFGYTRFLLEFARDKNKLFFGISELAMQAMFAAPVGTVWCVMVKKERSR